MTSKATVRPGAIVAAIFLSLTATATAAAAADRPAAVKVRWIGGPTMVIRFGPIRVLTDPVLGEGPQAFRIHDPNVGKPDVPQSRLAALPTLSLDGLSLVLVSHAHEDHLDQAAVDMLKRQAEFLVPVSQVDAVRKRGLARVYGLASGERRRISRGAHQLTIIAVAGRHSQRPELLPVLGDVNGYWLEFRRGDFRRTIYWTGDSFAPAEGIPEALQSPDLFIPHLGGVGANGPIGHVSMGWSHALAFAREVKPRTVLPIHHSTFSLYREPIELFVDAARTESFQVARLDEGDEFELK